MALNIYVAAPWVNREDAKRVSDKLRAAGMEVTSRWLTQEEDLTHDDLVKEERDAYVQQRAVEDIEDVIDADVLVVLNMNLSEGKSFEFGYAYALGKPTIVVGDRSRNIFYHLPGVFQTDTEDTLVDGLTAINNQQEVVEGELGGTGEEGVGEGKAYAGIGTGEKTH